MKINIGEPKKDKSADTIHIDNFDCWSLDYTLARIIHPALIRLKETKHGYPELWEDGTCKAAAKGIFVKVAMLS